MSITLLNMDEAGLEKYVEDILARPKEQPDKGQLLALVACLEKYFPSSSFYNKFQQIIKGEILPSQP